MAKPLWTKEKWFQEMDKLAHDIAKDKAARPTTTYLGLLDTSSAVSSDWQADCENAKAAMGLVLNDGTGFAHGVSARFRKTFRNGKRDGCTIEMCK